MWKARNRLASGEVNVRAWPGRKEGRKRRWLGCRKVRCSAKDDRRGGALAFQVEDELNIKKATFVGHFPLGKWVGGRRQVHVM